MVTILRAPDKNQQPFIFRPLLDAPAPVTTPVTTHLATTPQQRRRDHHVRDGPLLRRS